MNDLLQWTAVALILVFAVVWIIRRLSKKPSPCSSCSSRADCALLHEHKKVRKSQTHKRFVGGESKS